MSMPSVAGHSTIGFVPSASPPRLGELAVVVLLGLAGAVAAYLYRSGNLPAAGLVLGVPLAVVCMIQPRIGIYAYGFWQAWDSAIKFGGGMDVDRITIGKLIAIGVVMTGGVHALVSRMPITKSQQLFRWLFLLCIVATLSIVWSYGPGDSVRFAGQMWVQLALAWVVVKLVAVDRSHLKRLMFWVVLGALSASGYVLLFGMEQSAHLRATLGEQANPVSVAAALVLGLSCVPVLWLLMRSRIAKILLLPTGLVMLFAIFATGTRAGVAAVGAGILAVGLFSKARGLGPRLAVLLLAGILGMGSTLVVLSSGVMSERSEARLRNMLMLPARSWSPNAGMPRARRSEIWAMSMESYMKTGFVGTGLGATPVANEHLSGRYKDVHSSFLASLTELGPVGFTAFFAVHLVLLLCIWRLRMPGMKGAALAILVGFSLMGSTHTIYTTKWFWLPVTLLLVIIECDAREARKTATVKSLSA